MSNEEILERAERFYKNGNAYFLEGEYQTFRNCDYQVCCPLAAACQDSHIRYRGFSDEQIARDLEKSSDWVSGFLYAVDTEDKFIDVREHRLRNVNIILDEKGFKDGWELGKKARERFQQYKFVE